MVIAPSQRPLREIKPILSFRTLFRLFQHPSLTIVKGAGLIMKALIEEGEQEIGIKMQSLSLAEGALPQHLLSALYTESADGRYVLYAH